MFGYFVQLGIVLDKMEKLLFSEQFLGASRERNVQKIVKKLQRGRATSTHIWSKWFWKGLNSRSDCWPHQNRWWTLCHHEMVRKYSPRDYSKFIGTSTLPPLGMYGIKIPVRYPRFVIIWFIFQLLDYYQKYGQITIGGTIVPVQKDE